MDLEELDEIFEDNDEELLEFINDIRTYTIRERINHFTRWDEREFLNRFRLSKNTVENLLGQIIQNLRNENQQYHEIDPVTQLLLTLRFYATGSFYITMGDFCGIYKTTAGRIITKVTNALVSLRPHYIKFPNNEQGRRTVQLGFHRLSRFPKVIGAIDCTHIPLRSPGGHNAEFFRNRKGFFSLNTQVICDSKNYIMDIVARWPGSAHDSHIFNNSAIKQRFENGEFEGAVLLGDSGYPIRDYLMTPIPEPRTEGEHLYNRCHISTRTVVERTFGIWKRRFNILSCKIRSKLPLAQKIIIATAVLHNVAVLNRDRIDGEIPEENIVFVPQQNPPQNIRNVVQQSYINYFETLA